MRSLQERVAQAAEAALAAGKVVTPIDVLMRIGWLPRSGVDRWRQGRVDYLEDVISANLMKLARALRILRRWAERRGLRPSETVYVSARRDRRPLRFTKSGEPAIERAYQTHWLSPDLRGKEAERVRERAARAPELLVVAPLRDWECAVCGGSGQFLVMEKGGPICLACAEMDHLVVLPAGNAR